MEATWDVERAGEWYRVTARGRCPGCGAALAHEDLRRVAAGPPDTPALSVQPGRDGEVELLAEGWLLPLATHRCPQH